MIEHLELKLGSRDDAQSIAFMSRQFIEHGLPWSWGPERVAKHIDCPDSVVLTAWADHRLVGFAIMYFGPDKAHLNLLAVEPDYRRLGVGRRLMEWLEKSARVAGTLTVKLEVRAGNSKAQAFYRCLGYRETGFAPGYYSGKEAAVAMIHDLRCGPSQGTP
jgi:ribosomal-protein-alanine N-acetyltransferase